MRLTPRLLSQHAQLDPFQILSISRHADAAEIKRAYYDLVKRYHPDKPGAAKPKGFDFKDIVAAHDLLRDDFKRRQYLRYGLGWGSQPNSPAGYGSSSGRSPAGQQHDYGFNFDNMHNPWRPRDGSYRRTKHSHERGPFPSAAWDYGRSESTDFFSNSSSRGSATPDGEGVYTSNASFFGILVGLSALLYSVQFWRLAPPLPSSSSSSSSSGAPFSSLVASDPKDAPIYRESGIMKGRDKHHDEASRALGAAREGAQLYGNARREGIRRKVREATLEAVESGQIATGHGLTAEELPAKRSEDPYQYIRQSVPPQQRIRKRLRSRRSYTDDEPSPTRPLDIAELEGAKPRRPPEEASKA